MPEKTRLSTAVLYMIVGAVAGALLSLLVIWAVGSTGDHAGAAEASTGATGAVVADPGHVAELQGLAWGVFAAERLDEALKRATGEYLQAIAPKVVVLPRVVTYAVSKPKVTVSGGGGGGLLERIKGCESGGNYLAQNRHSTASGAYQILDSTWRGWRAMVPGAEVYDRAADAPPDVQDAVARAAFGDGNSAPWNASRACWG